ncbi:MAG: rRNA maturation RNase YbeY [Akkermansiaceae bacterium]
MEPFKLEIYPSCESRDLTAEFLADLHRGWLEVVGVLREIGAGKIASFSGLEITLLDDDEMARIHGEFLSDPTTTDVITFQHGELLIGVEVAERQAVDFGTTVEREIALYGIHGMLHLAGFDDRDPQDAQEMAERQQALLKEHFSA